MQNMRSDIELKENRIAAEAYETYKKLEQENKELIDYLEMVKGEL